MQQEDTEDAEERAARRNAARACARSAARPTGAVRSSARGTGRTATGTTPSGAACRNPRRGRSSKAAPRGSEPPPRQSTRYGARRGPMLVRRIPCSANRDGEGRSGGVRYLITGGSGYIGTRLV